MMQAKIDTLVANSMIIEIRTGSPFNILSDIVLKKAWMISRYVIS